MQQIANQNDLLQFFINQIIAYKIDKSFIDEDRLETIERSLVR